MDLCEEGHHRVVVGNEEEQESIMEKLLLLSSLPWWSLKGSPRKKPGRIFRLGRKMRSMLQP